MRAIIAAALICASSAASAETGIATHYGYRDGQTTQLACPRMGRLKTMTALTAAHRTLPCGTKVLVTNRRTKLSVVVVINDRGPFKRGRIIDLTYRAMQVINGNGREAVVIAALR